MDGVAAVDLNRLRWRCRRGMRELDVLLEGFLSRDWPGASAERRRAFVALLDLPDPELMDLCLGRGVAADPVLAAIVAEIMQSRSRELSGGGPVYTSDFGRARRPGQEQ